MRLLLSLNRIKSASYYHTISKAALLKDSALFIKQLPIYLTKRKCFINLSNPTVVVLD
jgi:hypothetical protein